MTNVLSDFNDLMTLQGPTILGGPEDIMNYVQVQTYTPAMLIAGREKEEIFQTGDRLQANIYLKSISGGEWYDPNGYERDETNPQTAKTITTDWRYYITSLRWTRQEVRHDVDSRLTGSALTHAYGKLMYKKRQNLWQSLVDDLEQQFWRVPDYTLMEGANAKYPFSIPALISEYRNATGISVPLDSSSSETTWTQQLGLSLTDSDHVRFRNERLAYTSQGGNDGSTGNLIVTLKRMARRLHYKPLPQRPEYGNAESRANVCMTSDLGISQMEAALLQGQDRWRVEDDGALTVAGVRYEWIEALDNLAVYGTGSALTTEDAASDTVQGQLHSAGARYYFVSRKGLCPMFFEGEFLTADEPMKSERQPLEYVQHYHLWAQLMPMNKRHLGVVFPAIS